ncbi:MAG TPA: peptidase M16 [Cytophagales bacterium]|nr:peptidase M16 [Cytophagales bacterium]HAA19053.1 peptidase M16 [Cytophagales bacterium]HAP59326.1 peptidase M16 [Cytophagales bacterium]
MKNFNWMRNALVMALLTGVILTGCDTASTSSNDQFSIDYEKIVLDNGLELVLHQDKSDPIVAVAVSVHVGSNREKPGRTGFAHFFEHMLFQKSENLPERAFFTNIDKYGGTFNGFTNTDNTVYFEVVPNDALEKVLWMESDRMGYFINAISVADMENEKGVVQNEKRQNYDNRPYGLQREAINKALYPGNHPYSWLTIGELEDLQNATLEDVQDFYQEWYGPNNATLVIAGDFDRDATVEMVKKYFGEIPARGNPVDPEPMPVKLTETKTIYFEDNFARLPRINYTFPTIEEFHKDEAALNALGQILAVGKRSPFYKVIVDKYKLAGDNNVYAFNSSAELAGTFTINVTANAGVDLDTVKLAIDEALTLFETESFDDRDLDRIKIGLETDVYNGISSVLNKAFQLAQNNEFAGDPGYLETSIKAIQDLTKEDIMRVYNTYVKGQHYVMSAWVPKGQTDLALEGAAMADVVVEDINNQYTIPDNLVSDNEAVMEKTPSVFDRSVEPDFGATPLLTPPTIWTDKLSNGMAVYGIEQSELPLATFVITMDGGMLLDDPNKVGVANLITDVMMEGTANKTPEELEDAIGQLGLNIGMYTSSEGIVISGNCLTRNLEASMALVEEILLQPRWDEKEFERLKNETLTSIKARESNPNAIAGQVVRKLVYGENHILSNSTSGTSESVASITIDDLKAYHEKFFSPSVANFHIAGAVSKADAMNLLSSMETNWAAKEVTIPTFEAAATPTEPKVYFVDVPGSRQSIIQITRLVDGLESNDDYYKAYISNDKLGGGASGELFRVLREERKYTYGAYSFFSRSDAAPTRFTASSSVQGSKTAEAVEAFNEVIGGYEELYNEDMLKDTRESIIRSNTRNYETLNNLIGILSTMSSYDLDANYIDRQQEIVNTITVEDVKTLVSEYMDLNRMIYVIVGDAETQLPRLKESGANVIQLDTKGNPIGDPMAGL